MINLLPEVEKTKLRREYWLRFGVIVFAIVLALEAFSFLLFVPTYFALHTSAKDLSENIEKRKALTPEDGPEIERALASVKKELGALQLSEGIIDVPPSALLVEILSHKPDGIEFSAIAYVRGADAPTLQISGTAATQDDLLAFRRNAQANPRILDFKYGSSFITQKSNIPYSAAITFK